MEQWLLIILLLRFNSLSLTSKIRLILFCLISRTEYGGIFYVKSFNTKKLKKYYNLKLKLEDLHVNLANTWLSSTLVEKMDHK